MADAMLTPESPTIISRDDARARGLKFFATGKPCKYGHVSPRYTKTGVCSGCTLKPPRIINPICKVDGCGKKKSSYGYCPKHCKAFRKYGDPLVQFNASPGVPLAWIEHNSTYDGDDCLIWPYGRTTFGYGQVTYNGRHTSAHAAMCEKVFGPKPHPKMVAAHSCGKGHLGCCSPKHVRWATYKENSDDKLLHGTKPFGQASGTAKLTETDIPVIRSLAGKVSQRKLAKQYGVSRTAIVKVIKGQNWWHVP